MNLDSESHNWLAFLVQPVVPFLSALVGGWLVHVLARKRDSISAARMKRAEYLQSCFEALTAFSAYIQFDKVRKTQNYDDLHRDLNGAINNMMLVGSDSLIEKLKKFEEVDADRLEDEGRIKLLEDLRREVRDQYRQELALPSVKSELYLTYWNFRKRPAP